MTKSRLVVLLLVTLTAGIAWFCGRGMVREAIAQNGALPGQSSHGIVVDSIALPDGRQQIALFDSESLTLAVYTIDKNGVIRLQNVRNCKWDLTLEVYNGAGLNPEDVRKQWEKK